MKKMKKFSFWVFTEKSNFQGGVHEKPIGGIAQKEGLGHSVDLRVWGFAKKKEMVFQRGG